MKKFQYHGLTPLQKYQKRRLLKSISIMQKSLSIKLEHQQKVFLGSFS